MKNLKLLLHFFKKKKICIPTNLWVAHNVFPGPWKQHKVTSLHANDCSLWRTVQWAINQRLVATDILWQLYQSCDPNQSQSEFVFCRNIFHQEAQSPISSPFSSLCLCIYLYIKTQYVGSSHYTPRQLGRKCRRDFERKTLMTMMCWCRLPSQRWSFAQKCTISG